MSQPYTIKNGTESAGRPASWSRSDVLPAFLIPELFVARSCH